MQEESHRDRLSYVSRKGKDAKGDGSHGTHLREKIVGGFFALLGILVGLWFEGSLQDVYTQKTKADDAERTVVAFLSDLVEAGHADKETRPDRVEDARGNTFRIPEKTWRRWDLAADPYVWTDLQVDSGDETRKRAFVGPKDDSTWALRRAKSGCWRLDGDFELVMTRGTWRIAKLPRLRTPCPPEALRATWVDGDATRGVIGWEGVYQRVDPLQADYSPRHLIKARENNDRAWSIRKSYDIGSFRTAQGHLPYDGELSTAWGADGPESYDEADPRGRSWGTLRYIFPTKVKLLRMRLHNGVETSGGYSDYGRIKSAVVEAGPRRIEVWLKDRIGSQRIDCSFGTTDSVSIKVTDVWPRKDTPVARSDVALSQIDFWGMPASAQVAPAPAGAYAWSDTPREPEREDVLECRDEPPPADLHAAAVATPDPTEATPSPTPSPVAPAASPGAATPDPAAPASPSPVVPASETPPAAPAG